MNRQARIRISGELLRQWLDLPDDVVIVGASALVGDCVEIGFHHPNLPDMGQNSVPLVELEHVRAACR